MKIAALLLLEVFVLLCQSAVVINPRKLRDGSKTHVDGRTIIQRAPPAGSSSTSTLGSISVSGGEGRETTYLNLIPGQVSGPPDRLYDWDESCNDSTQRQKITDAYNMAVKLAEESAAKLRTLADGLPKKPPTANPNPENQNWIARTDPAYTQMFFALDGRIEEVRNIYEKMIYGMKSSRTDSRSTRNGVFLRFVCNPGVKDNNDKLVCEGGTHAVTTNIRNKDTLEEIYAFGRSASIIFCSPFFDDAQFPSTQVLEEHADQHCNLDKVQSRDLIMIHEWTHLEWAGDLPGGMENYGYEKSAKTAGSGTTSATGKDRKADWLNAKRNADNFAWYAIYHHWNELCPHMTAGNSCGDVWPQGGTGKDPTSLNFWKPPKPNRIQF